MVTEKKRICITGAAGQTGRHVLKSLAPFAEQFEICAITHLASEAEQEATVKSLCPSVVSYAVDADDFDGLQNLLSTPSPVSALFIIPSATETKVRHAFNYLRAAKRAMVEFVAVLSMTGSERRDYLWADQFWSIEEEARRLKFNGLCILRSSFYLQNLLLYTDQYAEGWVPLPIGPKARFAPVDVHDIGEAAAAVLADYKPHIGKTYSITGPEALTALQITDTLSEFLRTEAQASSKLEWHDISLSEAKQILVKSNVPPSEIQGLIEFYRWLSETGEQYEDVSGDFKELVGRNPNSMRDWLKRIREHMLAALKLSTSTTKASEQQQQQQSFSQATSSQA